MREYWLTSAIGRCGGLYVTVSVSKLTSYSLFVASMASQFLAYLNTLARM